MSGTGVQDRCRGVLLGLAAGDRNGGPIRMAVRLAESLLELGRFDPADTVGRYLRWWRGGALATRPRRGRGRRVLAGGPGAPRAARALTAAPRAVGRQAGGLQPGAPLLAPGHPRPARDRRPSRLGHHRGPPHSPRPPGRRRGSSGCGTLPVLDSWGCVGKRLTAV